MNSFFGKTLKTSCNNMWAQVYYDSRTLKVLGKVLQFKTKRVHTKSKKDNSAKVVTGVTDFFGCGFPTFCFYKILYGVSYSILFW